jgi:hypothetical protein
MASSRDVVLAAMMDEVARSDAGIEQITGLSHSKVSGARVALWEEGLVERLGKDPQSHWLWRLCPPERREEAKLAYRDHKEKLLLARLLNKDASARASIVLELLASRDVNAAVIAQLGRRKYFRRIQARVNEARADREADARHRKRQIAQKHEEADTGLTFLLILDRLRDAVDALLLMREQISAETDRYLRGEPGKVNYSRWPEVARNVREVLEVARVVYGEVALIMEEPMNSCPLCGERLGSVTAELDSGYVDGTVEEVEDDDFATA